MHFSILSDLKKTTVVVESLSIIQPDVLFQRLPAYFKTFTKIKLDLKRNILNFDYSINYKYEGMLAHPFDKFYVVTKLILLSIEDLNFSTLNYDNTCAYLDNKYMHDTESMKHMLDLMMFCKRIELFVLYYKELIKSYNKTVHNILESEINLILPQMPWKQKHGIITMLVSSFIGLSLILQHAISHIWH